MHSITTLKTEQAIVSHPNYFMFASLCSDKMSEGWVVIPETVRASENSYVAFFQRVIEETKVASPTGYETTGSIYDKH